MLCAPCSEAFALARDAHPSAGGTPIPTEVDAPAGADDMDMWDAWSRLGDVGGRPERSRSG